MFGVPYASQKVVGRKVYAICPVCKEEIALKLSDSPSTKAYAAHYAAKHGEKA